MEILEGGWGTGVWDGSRGWTRWVWGRNPQDLLVGKGGDVRSPGSPKVLLQVDRWVIFLFLLADITPLTLYS
jgi:hypothetical protein